MSSFFTLVDFYCHKITSNIQTKIQNSAPVNTFDVRVQSEFSSNLNLQMQTVKCTRVAFHYGYALNYCLYFRCFKF